MAVLSAVRDQLDTTKADQARAQEQLDFLLKMAQGRMKLYQEELKVALSGGGGDSPIKIVGGPIKFAEGYTVNVSSSPSAGISSAVDSFFTGTAGLKSAFASLVKVGLNAILGNSSTGEQEDTQVFIAMEHNAIVRVDIRAWRYNFTNDSIIGTVQNAFCYTFCKSVVDLDQVSKSTLIYLINEQAGDDQQVASEYIAMIKQQYDAVKGLAPTPLRADYAYATALTKVEQPSVLA